MSAQSSSALKSNICITVLFGILALAATLRLVGLGAESLWGDEILSVLASRGYWLDIVTERTTFNQPFYFLMLHGWMKLFGESEFALRFPSAVLGVGTVLFTFILTRHLLNVWIALGAALLVAVSPVMIWYSQEARFYALTTFLLVVSTYSLIRYLETRRIFFLAAYALTALLGAYTHYYFLLFVAAHNLVALVWFLGAWRWTDVIKWAAAQLIVSLALISKVTTVIADVSLAAGDAFTLPLPKALDHFVHAVGLADPDLGGPFPLVVAVWVITLAGSAVAIWRREKAAVLIVICLAALGQFIVGGLYFDLPVLLRYLSPTIPLWIIITCYGFAWLISRPYPQPSRSLAAVGVLILLGWTLTSWNQQLTTPTKGHWREIAGFIENNALPSDNLFVVPPRHYKHLNFYLEKSNPGESPPQWGSGRTPTCDQERRAWLVGDPSLLTEAAIQMRQSCSGTVSTQVPGFSDVMLVQPSSIVVQASGSSILCNGIVPDVLGSEADDRLVGTEGDDVIHGMGGNDRTIGKGGNDVLCGGEGDDKISGESGDDIILGNEGDDILYSGAGNNVLNGGPGVDKCYGGGSNRVLECENTD